MREHEIKPFKLGISKHETREEHPLMAVVTHWIHLISMIALIWTGFFIHSPFYQGSTIINKTVHTLFAFILIATGVVRMYWAFFGKGSAPCGGRAKIRDYKFFLPQKENRGKLVPMTKYYLFLRETHPRTFKYNPLQKTAYVSLIVFITVQIITGFSLLTATAQFFLPLTYLLGGTAMVRSIHYLTTWGFIFITMIHIYLAFTETIHELPLMFLWREVHVMERWYGLKRDELEER